jgi:plasmid stabilization system protein ParE
MDRNPRKKVTLRPDFEQDLTAVYSYGAETFGSVAAKSFVLDVFDHVNTLAEHSEMHPECRFLRTPSKNFRNIVLGSYLIIYHTDETSVEVLRMLHSSSSIRKIKSAKSAR